MKNTELLPSKRNFLISKLLILTVMTISVLLLIAYVTYIITMIALYGVDSVANEHYGYFLIMWAVVTLLTVFYAQPTYLKYRIYVKKNLKLRQRLSKRFYYRTLVKEWDLLFLEEEALPLIQTQ